ncbi:MAG TPA: hypothetical protein VGN53_05960 [Klebsiella sp.]|jgi:hypothetical protein
MKFNELPEKIQEQAAIALANEIQGIVAWKDEERTEKAIAIAVSVRECFTKLFSAN